MLEFEPFIHGCPDQITEIVGPITDFRSRAGDLENHRSVGPDNHVCYWYKF